MYAYVLIFMTNQLSHFQEKVACKKKKILKLKKHHFKIVNTLCIIFFVLISCEARDHYLYTASNSISRIANFLAIKFWSHYSYWPSKVLCAKCLGVYTNIWPVHDTIYLIKYMQHTYQSIMFTWLMHVPSLPEQSYRTVDVTALTDLVSSVFVVSPNGVRESRSQCHPAQVRH